MSSVQRARWSIAMIVGLIVWSPSARAALDDANKESVRLLADDAAAEYERDHLVQALEKFQRAYDTAKVPTLALWLAKTHVKLGHLGTAIELCRQAAGLEKNELWIGDIQQEAQRDAESLRAEIQGRLARVVVTIEGAAPKDVLLQIDQVEVPSSLIGVDRLVDPGERQIVGRLGQQVAEVRITLAEGEKKEVRLKFSASPVAPRQADSVTLQRPPQSTQTNSAPPPSNGSSGKSARTLGWVAIAAGGAGVALGAATGIAVAIKHSNLSQQCPKDQCEPEHWSDLDSYERWRTVSTVGFIVGGVGVAAGITLLLTGPKKESSPQVAFWMAPQSAGLKGAF